MEKKWVSIAGVALAFASTLLLQSRIYADKETDTTSPRHLDAEYVIAGIPVKLSSGISEAEKSVSSPAKIITRYFGKKLFHDLDGDGRKDILFILTQETGGSGIFYYLVGALDRPDGIIGSNGLFLGDRIVPREILVGSQNLFVVKYLDRGREESFAMSPSVEKSMMLRFDVDALDFRVVVEDFEGEADPQSMSLAMRHWTWVKVIHEGGRELTPRQEQAFTLNLREDGRFTATTDCNQLAGNYETEDGRLRISDLAATRMYCEDSQEMEYAGFLKSVTGYRFTSKGELILILGAEGEFMVFR